MEILFFPKLGVELDMRKLNMFDRILIGFVHHTPGTRTAEAIRRICSVLPFYYSWCFTNKSPGSLLLLIDCIISCCFEEK